MTTSDQNPTSTPPSNHIILKDGRQLHYTQHGPATGTPIIHCHGSGGSRLEHPVDTSFLTSLNIRFISVDRPGHGLSSPSPHRTLLSFADDIDQLTDRLNISKFYVEGWSAGGSYALAIARALPHKVLAVAILSGIGPHDRPRPYYGCNSMLKVWMFMSRHPYVTLGAVRSFRRMMYNQIKDMEVEQLGEMLTPRETATYSLALDEKIVANTPKLRNAMARNIQEGYKQGYLQAVQDDYIVNGPWGFDLKDVKCRVHIWQGEVDENVPLCQGEYIHKYVGGRSDLTVLVGCAHLFPLARWREILEQFMREE